MRPISATIPILTNSPVISIYIRLRTKAEPAKGWLSFVVSSNYRENSISIYLFSCFRLRCPLSRAENFLALPTYAVMGGTFRWKNRLVITMMIRRTMMMMMMKIWRRYRCFIPVLAVIINRWPLLGWTVSLSAGVQGEARSVFWCGFNGWWIGSTGLQGLPFVHLSLHPSPADRVVRGATWWWWWGTPHSHRSRTVTPPNSCYPYFLCY